MGLLLPSMSSADAPASTGARPASLAQAADGDLSWFEKVQGGLLALSVQARSGNSPNQADAMTHGASLVGDRIRVVVEASGGNRSAARAAIRDVGGQVEIEYGDLVQALVPADRIPELAADRRVHYVRTPYDAAPRAIAGEGVGASGAAAWQAAGINGAGVKVAVIDGGFGGLQARKDNGDLPASATVVDLCNGQTNDGVHGTGVAEIVYEMAPAAQLLLYCVAGEVALGQAKDQAKAAGANIITMSLAFFNTSRGDGTGGPSTPEGIVADARNSGIFWVNSAGNAAAGEAWYGPWVDADNDGYLDFSPTRRANQFTLGANANVCVELSWDAWPTSNQDFALEVHDPANFANILVPVADNLQNGTQAPTERECINNATAAPVAYDLAIKRVNATAPFPPRFTLQVFNQRLEFFKTDSNIDIPATSPSAFAVGAVCWQSDRLEDYSSRGPTIDGRIKPDIAAQSDVSSGSYGNWIACPADADGQGGFNGTSAAAPHAAGAAALVKQAFPAFSPSQIQSFLEGRARDAGPPGKDNGYGVGILTLGAAPNTGLPTSTPTLTVTPGGPTSTPTRTPTITLTPTITPTRGPAISLSVTRNGANALLVVVTARPGDLIQRIDWTLPANATAETTTGTPLPTGIVATGNGVQSTSFILRRTGGSAATLPMVVRGTFGQWNTFAGGGPNAWGP
jgi:subtilisin family serine protease